MQTIYVYILPTKKFRHVHLRGVHQLVEDNRDIANAMDTAEKDLFEAIYFYTDNPKHFKTIERHASVCACEKFDYFVRIEKRAKKPKGELIPFKQKQRDVNPRVRFQNLMLERAGLMGQIIDLNNYFKKRSAA